MSAFKDRIEEYLTSSAHLSKKHIHPRLAKMFEAGGMSAVFTRAENQYVWDQHGDRYLDWLSGGGVYFMGRNNPQIAEALQDVMAMNLPNLSVVNASVLGGLLAEKLIEIAGPQFTKVQYSNSGAEATEVAVRFARQITRRRRFLYLEGAFHGRSYAAISMCGFASMRENIEPAMPVCTPVKAGDIAQLRRELKYGDVAAFIFEPLQGMTGKLVDTAYLREAEALCQQHGTVMIADEIQCGLARTGSWFVSRELGIRPDMMTVSKTLSGGYVPVGAVLVSEAIYEKVYSGFSSGLVYFSTFAENNLAMAAGIATIDFLQQIDACAQAKAKGDLIRAGLERIAAKYDVIASLEGKGLMQTVYFKDSANAALAAQQAVMKGVDSGAFAAAVHVDLFKRQRVVAQIPGPGVNAIKVLPPVTTTEEDIAYFLAAFEDTISAFYSPTTGPVVTLTRGTVEQTLKTARSLIPEAAVPALFRISSDAEKKNLTLR